MVSRIKQKKVLGTLTEVTIIIRGGNWKILGGSKHSENGLL